MTDRSAYWRAPGYVLLLAFAGLETLVAAPMRFLPKVLSEAGFSPGDVGALMSGGGIGSALALLPSTHLAHRHPRLGMVTGALLQGAALLLPLLGLHKPTLFALFFATSVGQSLVFASAFTVIAEATPSAHATRGLALYWALVQLSRNLVGPALAEGALTRTSFATTAAMFGGLALAGAAARALMPLPRPAPPGERTQHRAEFHRVVRLAVLFLLAGVLFVAQDGFLTAFAAARRLSPITPFLVGYAIVMIVGRVWLGGLPDRIGKRRAVGASLLVWAIFFAGMSRATHAPEFWALGLVAGAANTLLWPSLYAISYEVIPTKAYATATTTLLMSAAWFLGAPALGGVTDRLGYGGTFGGAALVCVAAALLIGWLAP